MMRRLLLSLAGCGSLYLGSASLAEPPAVPPPVPTLLQKARAAVEKGDVEGAVKLLQPEAEKGNAEAANALGELRIAGRGIKASGVEAAKWFQKAADAGNAAAQFNLSRLLFLGSDGIAKDEEKATFLLRTSAEAGYGPAQAQMGGTVESLAARTENKAHVAEAREWYEKAAVQNQPDALQG